MTHRRYAYKMPPNIHCEDDATCQKWMVSLWNTDEKCSRIGTDQFSLAFEVLIWLSWDKNNIQEVVILNWVHRQVIFFLYLIKTYSFILQRLHTESSQKCNQGDFHHHHGDVLSCTYTGSFSKSWERSFGSAHAEPTPSSKRFTEKECVPNQTTQLGQLPQKLLGFKVVRFAMETHT